MMNGTIIANKYLVIQEIARGAMGIVYLATHTTLGRQVAIKTLHPQYYTDPAFTKRFIREAQAMAKLDHENIIRIFDILKTDEEFHIVMEYCSGLTLKDYMLKHKDIPVGKAMNIAYQVATGLAFAHAYDMVHRDVKPANIMIEESGRIKIADFGIVAGEESNLTVTGELVGTPHYMSPEQARGESVDSRSDLYSLGIVMMQMITGKTPLNGHSILGIIGKLAYSHEEYDVVFPPKASDELANIIRTLIKKKPDDRFYDARSLSETLFHLMHQLSDDPGSTRLYLSETDRLFRPNFLEDTHGSRHLLSHSSQPGFETDDEASTQVIPLPPLSDLIDNKHHSNKKTWVGVLLLLLFAGVAGVVFYKKQYQPWLLPEDHPRQVLVPQASIPEDLIATQSSIDRALENISFAKKNAANADTSTRSTEKFQEANTLETEASSLFGEIENDIKKHQYDDARLAMSKVLALLNKAHLIYNTANEVAEQNDLQAIKNDVEKIKLDVRRKRKEAINHSDNALIANAEVYAKTTLVEARQFKKLAENIRRSASEYERGQYYKEALTLYEQALFYFSQTSQLFAEAETLSVNNQRDKNIKKLIVMNQQLINEYNTIKHQITTLENTQGVVKHAEKIYQNSLESAKSAQKFLENNAHDKAYRAYRKTRKQLNQAIAVLDESLKTANQAKITKEITMVQTKIAKQQQMIINKRSQLIALNADRWAKQQRLKAEASTRIGEQQNTQANDSLASRDYSKAKSEYEVSLQTLKEAMGMYHAAYKAALAAKVEHEASPSRPDVDIVGEKLQKFLMAYQSKDLGALQKITTMSSERLSFLKQLFNNYQEIDLKIDGFTLNVESAVAMVVINQLKSVAGDVVIPSKAWQKAELSLEKQNGQWGKISW